MNREAWSAAVHGVTKSQTRLSDWTEFELIQLYHLEWRLSTQRCSTSINWMKKFFDPCLFIYLFFTHNFFQRRDFEAFFIVLFFPSLLPSFLFFRFLFSFLPSFFLSSVLSSYLQSFLSFFPHFPPSFFLFLFLFLTEIWRFWYLAFFKKWQLKAKSNVFVIIQFWKGVFGSGLYIYHAYIYRYIYHIYIDIYISYMACMIIFFLVGAKKQMFCLEQCKHVLNIFRFSDL